MRGPMRAPTKQALYAEIERLRALLAERDEVAAEQRAPGWLQRWAALVWAL